MPVVASGVTEYLEINSYPLASPAVRLLDLSPLWTFGYRRFPVPVPYVSGSAPHPVRYEEVIVSLPGKIFGHVDSDGAAIADYRAGLTARMDELFTAVLAEVTTGDGTRAAVWHRADGTTRIADVQVAGFEAQTPVAMELDFTLELAVPAGVWVAP